MGALALRFGLTHEFAVVVLRDVHVVTVRPHAGAREVLTDDV